MAQHTARQQILNASMQLMVAKAQAKLQKRMAEAQFRLRQSEANAHFSNAAMIEQTTEARSGVVRENIRRKAGEYRRFQGTQRARIAPVAQRAAALEHPARQQFMKQAPQLRDSAK